MENCCYLSIGQLHEHSTYEQIETTKVLQK